MAMLNNQRVITNVIVLYEQSDVLYANYVIFYLM